MIECYGYGDREIRHGHVAPVRTAAAIVELRWGLTPPWRGHGGKRGPLVHAAHVDDVARVPMLRDAWKKQRCAVLADRYRVGVRWVYGNGGLAGLWAERDDGVTSFAILHVGDEPALATDAWLAGETATLAAAAWQPRQGELF